MSKSTGSMLEALCAVSSTLFGDAKFILPHLESLRVDVQKSGMLISFERYASIVPLATLIGSFVSAAIATVALAILKAPLSISIAFFVSLCMFGSFVGFSFAYFYPAMKVMMRKHKIAEELPYAVSHMATLASAGLNPLEIFYRLYEERSKDVVTEEAGLIVRDVEFLGYDVLTAMKRAKLRSPHPEFSELLDGMSATAKMGGDLATFLSNFYRTVSFERRVSVRMFTGIAAMLAEIYVVLMVFFPMIAIIIFSVMGAIGGGMLMGLAVVDLMSILIYLFVPALGAALMLIFDLLIPKV